MSRDKPCIIRIPIHQPLQWKVICFFTCSSHACLYEEVPSLKLTARTQKWMVGRRFVSFWGPAYFQGLSGCQFQGGYLDICVTIPTIFPCHSKRVFCRARRMPSQATRAHMKCVMER